MNEVWKDIMGYEGYYQVSNLGRVRSLPRLTHVIGVTRKDGSLRNESWQRLGKLLTPIYTGTSTAYVHLHKEGEPRRNVAIKRLVAEAFLAGFDPNKSTNTIRFYDPCGGCAASNLYLTYALKASTTKCVRGS